MQMVASGARPFPGTIGNNSRCRSVLVNWGPVRFAPMVTLCSNAAKDAMGARGGSAFTCCKHDINEARQRRQRASDVPVGTIASLPPRHVLDFVGQSSRLFNEPRRIVPTNGLVSKRSAIEKSNHLAGQRIPFSSDS